MRKYKSFLKICLIFCGGCVLRAAQRQPLLEVFANPIVDVAFRHIMSNEEIAMSLINSVVPDFKDNPVTEIKKAFDKIAVSSKRDAFMDFHATTDKKDKVIIEMQAKRHAMFDERALYYAAYTYSHQLSEEVLKRHDWHESLRLVYAIQFLDYDTQRIRGIQPKEGEEDLDRPFIDEVQAHPMREDEFMKHYVMTDQNSGQTIKRGMHLIQIELPRVTSIRALSPRQDNFVERSEDFSLSDWWYCVLKHAEEFDVAELGDDYGNRSAKFIYMPKPIYNAFKMLRREAWGPDLQIAYNRDDLEIEKYSTAIAVERHEGRQEGMIIGSLVGEFVATGKLSRKSLKGIKQNPLSEDQIRAIWNMRETEIAELGSGEEEEEIPEGRTVDDFIAYLKVKGVIATEGEGEN
ncbi:MAG: Rpn family recombination-promoting nuclease/putative transposase [Puniceicoccales bacterium]|jgi:predicted transposase/invertase (TIGR01784 family)|nr:Rpn family recombination-promoting nuclease/putative transposase [Puniceicoccales bacterium]